MKRALTAFALLAAGCAASSTGGTASAPDSPAAPKKDTHGCATARSGLAAYSDMLDGIQNKTATPADTAKSMGKIADKMDSVATIAAPELATHAKAAALAAGHLRVALLGQGDFDVATENRTMGSELDAVALYCKDA
jgi:hypothetical protein